MAINKMSFLEKQAYHGNYKDYRSVLWSVDSPGQYALYDIGYARIFRKYVLFSAASIYFKWAGCGISFKVMADFRINVLFQK